MSELSQAKQAKRIVVDQIKEYITNAHSFVVLDYKGLTVEQDTEFRKMFREQDVHYRVLKNTLVKIALHELGYTEFDEFFNGPTAIAFGLSDALAPAKIADAGMAKFKAIEMKCGMFDKKFTDKDTVMALAKVPSKPVLLSMLLSVLTAPVRGLAVALNAVAEKHE